MIAARALLPLAWAAVVSSCDVETYYSDADVQAIIAGTSTLSREEKRGVLHDLVVKDYNRCDARIRMAIAARG
eukprot:scaffold1474_cov256-Pinguiococcus_pyrenoidosus.AAC.25